jgi:putative phosphoesterase
VRLGIVSDVHCNLAGLQRALALMDGIDELLCLGDSIFEYRFSNDVVALLRERQAQVILGNHEEGFLAPGGERARAQDWIDRDHLVWLASRPLRHWLVRDGRRLLMVHSTPWEPRGAYIHPESQQLARFGEVDADVVMYGHTHHQVVRRIGPVLVVNPGSAGDARDHRNGRQLSCAVLDTATLDVTVIDYPDERLTQAVGSAVGSAAGQGR